MGAFSIPRIDKESHQVFIEPEGLTTHELYPNGISTSLPFDVQIQIVQSIRGMENAHIVRPGYAIEYDYFDPRDLKYSLETKVIGGLFFAGQINGTTGYEEAGAQGLLAGTNPRDIGGFIKELKKWQFSCLLGLNTLFVALLDHPDFKTLDFSHLKITNSGGTALIKATAERWKAVTGCSIGEGYGLTETSPVASTNPYGSQSRLGTVGIPVPGTAMKVIDDDGHELPLGERGELCIKGTQVMKGYWQQPAATAEALDADGWFKTGDIAVIDNDGFVSIVDRKKDLIIVSGFNVYPNEIEDVVMAHPAVANCAVIGVPDDRTGEAVKLFVVARTQGVSLEELKAYCKTNFTGYKVPKHIVLRDSLPMTPVGKILRRELRDIA